MNEFAGTIAHSLNYICSSEPGRAQSLFQVDKQTGMIEAHAPNEVTMRAIGNLSREGVVMAQLAASPTPYSPPKLVIDPENVLVQELINAEGREKDRRANFDPVIVERLNQAIPNRLGVNFRSDGHSLVAQDKSGNRDDLSAMRPIYDQLKELKSVGAIGDWTFESDPNYPAARNIVVQEVNPEALRHHVRSHAQQAAQAPASSAPTTQRPTPPRMGGQAS